MTTFYFDQVLDLRMCDKILRDGLSFVRSLDQPSEIIVKELLRATIEFTVKTTSLNDKMLDQKS
jgi:hypothetical protein